ncbi:uncharacterized protein si:ch211-285c6.2 [Danio rerio]|uniref:Si:ch211-285c6.2 n=14 Tax=Danio rerio TaxID=7955 RepID=A0A8M6Z1L5_DANRE|nr:calcium/calmodulin-dependent protein kinase type 1D [Danio rerio]XP_017212427.1 calcium/calmodulin-dependent protein kinase type 1D [Danio rerio]|eukprot:XP_005160445.1 calcium/calmodulin-dependent protein kinase type 1D [Danio rerio]
MGNKQSTSNPGYTLVKSNDEKILAKNESGDQFAVKKLRAGQEKDVNFLLHLNHPHIVHHKEIIRDGDCIYLVLDYFEAEDLAEKIKHKTQTAGQFSEKEILDWTVQICMALKYLHDQQILHKDLQPKSLLFTACGTIRLGEFDKKFTDAPTAESESLANVAPEILSGKSYNKKSEIWRLGCVINEMCTLRRAFSSRNSDEIVKKIRRSSYEHLPENFSEDLHELIKDTLQVRPADRPSVSEILKRPFIIKHLNKMSKQTIEELNKSLDELRTLANDLEKIHFNTTVGSLAGGVIGLVGGILSVVGLILTPFTLGASLIVTGVGVGVATAGGVTAGVSNVTKIVNQRSNRQNVKMLITMIQEKITSTSCCIQNIQIAVGTKLKEFPESDQPQSNAQSENSDKQTLASGARLGRGLAGISELARLVEVASVGKVAAQTARVARVAEVATGVLSGLFIAVDVFFIALDAKEIHDLRQDTASSETQQEPENAASNRGQSPETTNDTSEQSKTKNLTNTKKKEQELRTEIMKFVKTIRETEKELSNILDELREELQELQPKIPNSYDDDDELMMMMNRSRLSFQ